MRTPSLRGIQNLDANLAGRRAELTALLSPGSHGWISKVRYLVGMTSMELAALLGVSQPAISKAESNERQGRITIGQLEKVARALDCTLVYGFVPNNSFEAIAHERCNL